MTNGSNLVTIRDIDVPFWRIVMILVKWSIASIPAMIILMLLASLIAAIVGVILAAIGVHVPTPPTPTPSGLGAPKHPAGHRIEFLDEFRIARFGRRDDRGIERPV